MNHTPGPWIVDHMDDGHPFVRQTDEAADLCQGEPDPRGIAGFGIEWKPTAEDWANFRLIAAAPELLQVLQDVLRSAGYESGEAEPTLRGLQVGLKYLDAARAAIAKATS